MVKRIKITFIVVKKGTDLITIMVREDKKVLFNFGSDNWVDFTLMGKLKIKNQQYNRYVNNPGFTKNYKQTQDIISKNNYEEIINSFHKDFKKDRGNMIKIISQEADVDG